MTVIPSLGVSQISEQAHSKMATAEGGGSRESATMQAWKSLAGRVEAQALLVKKKEAYLQQLVDQAASAAAGDPDRKMMETSIKAFQLDLEADVDALKGLSQDTDALKAALDLEMREGDEGEEKIDAEEGKTFTAAEVKQMMRDRETDERMDIMNNRMDRLISTLASRPDSSHRDPPRGETPLTDRKRILGQVPNFVTGQTDFTIHVESFKDFCELNDITQSDKVKRLFLMSLDQVARMRCSGLEPDRAPCLTMTSDQYISRLQEMFVPRATLLVVQQAFHELRQKPNELATDYLMNKFSHFKRGWANPAAPFSFFYEGATAGLYDEGLRNEVYRNVVECTDSNSRVEMNAAFQAYLERVQQALAYIRRTSSASNPDSRGLGITGQPTRPSGKSAFTVSEVMEQPEGGENYCQEYEEELEVEELSEQQIAVVEVMEDPRFTQLVEEDYQEVAETGTKLCFLCRSPQHLARNCGMRLRNLSSAMSQMGLSARGSSRGWRGPGRRWRGGSGGRARNPARGRAAPLGGFPTQLPPGGHNSMRPITSSQPGSPRNQDF